MPPNPPHIQEANFLAYDGELLHMEFDRVAKVININGFKYSMGLLAANTWCKIGQKIEIVDINNNVISFKRFN